MRLSSARVQTPPPSSSLGPPTPQQGGPGLRQLVAGLALLGSAPALAADAVPVPVALFGRLHFPLLHFPLALLFVVLFLEVALRSREELRQEVTGRLLGLCAGFAVVTVLAGLAYAVGEEFNGASADTFFWHRALGIVVAVVSVLLVLVRRSARLARAYVPLLLLGVGSVSVAGHLGGELVHGQGFYTRPLRSEGERRANAGDEGPTFSYDDGDGVGDARQRYAEGPIPGKPDYRKDIQPIFRRSCVKCHGPEKRKSGLRLDEKRFALKGGESGPLALVPGDADKSLIFTMAGKPPDDEDIMPSKGKLLSLSEIETLKRWIDQGAPWPDPTP